MKIREPARIYISRRPVGLLVAVDIKYLTFLLVNAVFRILPFKSTCSLIIRARRETGIPTWNNLYTIS